MLIAIGAVKKKPVVVNNEIKIRDIVNIVLTIDQRFTDGVKIASAHKKFNEYLNDPEASIMKYETSQSLA